MKIPNASRGWICGHRMIGCREAEFRVADLTSLFQQCPKRPRTAYLLFAEDCRSKLKKTQPDLGFTEVSKVVSSEWKELPENKKQQYVRNAEKEQERHRVLKAQWEAKHPVA